MLRSASSVTRESRYDKGLEAAGLVIEDGRDWRGRYTFDDVAALVAYLQRVPWDAPRTSR